VTVIHGDCLDVMAGMEPETFDAIVTDPPYNLTAEFNWTALGENLNPTGLRPKGRTSTRRRAAGFMGKQWDGTGIAFRRETWEAAYRVAKPSAYLLAFGGTRTVHRMTVALEDAGWVIRDMLVWAYASGFPKSKASLKPAWEPIVMARKPGPLRMLAIDECRIPFVSDADKAESTDKASGRWPANLVLTDPVFDGGIEGVVGGGETSSGRLGVGHGSGNTFGVGNEDKKPNLIDREYGNDSGTYSRFFLISKADRADREPVLGGLPTRDQASTWGDIGPVEGNPRKPANGHVTRRQNVHPTVKPVDLMRHLVRLVTPTGGRVLDPFLGSGTTAIAAEMEGFAWTGIEREAEYVAIAEARLNGTQRGLGLETA
jgi:site-specific DNA-methyltransferase (adenine-specific)